MLVRCALEFSPDSLTHANSAADPFLFDVTSVKCSALKKGRGQCMCVSVLVLRAGEALLCQLSLTGLLCEFCVSLLFYLTCITITWPEGNCHPRFVVFY